MADVKLVSDAHALQSMRASDFDACSAYGEVVDNAIQANAEKIKIEFSYRSKPSTAMPLEYVAFGDDGEGMDPDTLQRCLQLGYSTRFNDRGGIGRFGVGVTLAAINQCKLVELFSKQVGGGWYFTRIDLDEISSGRQSGIPDPIEREIPSEFQKLVGKESGTLMVWRKHDKQDTPGMRLLEEMKVWAGRTYRYFIWDGVEIELNGERVPAIDPLYVRTDLTGFPGDPAAEEYSPITLSWPVPSQLDVFAQEVPNNSDISIRMSLLPEKFRLTQGSGNLKSNKDRQIHLNEGISILRNRREVFYGRVPWWPGDDWKEIDRWWGCEISFEAILDYQFSVKNIKRGAVPLRELKKAIADKVEPTRKTALEKVREVWQREDEREREKEAKRRHTKAEKIAKKGDPSLPKGEIDKEKNADQEFEKFTQEYLEGKSAEEKARWRELFRSQPFTIEDDSWKGAEFLDIKHLGGRDILLYNVRHLFHETVSDLESRIDGTDEAGIAQDLRSLIDLLLISYSKAESMFPADQENLLEQLRMYWGNHLQQYIREWLREAQ